MIVSFQDLPFYFHNYKYTLLFSIRNYQITYFPNPFQLHSRIK